MALGAAQRREQDQVNLFIFGVGFSGLEIAKTALSEGAVVAGTTRSPAKAERLALAGIEPFILDGGADVSTIRQRLKAVTHLVISIGPDRSGDPVLNTLRTDISSTMPELRWLGYLSTVGVYGDHQGAWVNEEINTPLAILRLSGIYGRGRNTFVNLADGTAKRIIKPGQFFNRIHVKDIAGAVLHLAKTETGGVFNVTDDEPAPPQDVVSFAARLANMPMPPEISYDDAQMSEMARSFYGEVKRVSNAKLRKNGYDLAYPNYRIALEKMWEQNAWE
jgi:nucleoside-diphosphate-sugar epimerase